MKNKIIFAFIFTLFGIGVCYAAEMILGNEVSFNNGKTNLKATNMQDAVEELYNKTINETSCENISKPNLGENNELIPVVIDSNGTVTYVSGSDENWYNYCDKRWANAVILEDDVSYKVGDIINEDDIESYFVWIPKYKYKLWNTGVASKKIHEIEIVFDEKNTTDIEGYSCAAPMISGETGNCDNGEYMTHPAFISFNSNGFWVGKFETGYRDASTTVGAASANTISPDKVIVKPNVYSWRNISVYNAFLSSYNYERELDSHMMKNTEWGAVAYLSHSKYGINSEVNNNNNTSYRTGYSALPSTNQQVSPGVIGDGDAYNQPYNTEVGYLASTTGNITGVYDMSGGAHEYVSGWKNNEVGSSGFTLTSIKEYDDKYFDVYNESSTENSYQYRILGDATGEMGPIVTLSGGKSYQNSWYGDDSRFVTYNFAWFHRGGGFFDSGVLSGQFNFFCFNGSNYESMISFRLVLTP